jgi:maltooligosyltrehalose trehalohydrolase
MVQSRSSVQRKVGSRAGPAGVSYCVWAPRLGNLGVVVTRGGDTWRVPMGRDEEGYWLGLDEGGLAGDRYRLHLPDGALLPDVASRFQPQGVHGPSECVDPDAYAWHSTAWQRPRWTGQTTYELHVGAFSTEGTFRAAAAHLDAVADVGAEAIELMPVADFAGDRNWGYDGVCLFAPARCYGRPDDLRALVDGAHALGLAVILDVVYNHVGPQGNYLARYSPDYFRGDRETPWGRPFNLDGENSAAVRAFLVQNATYWLDEFRIDGLRLDATHAIPDSSGRPILEEIAEAVHARGGFVIAEDERNQADLARGAGERDRRMDALWADDFHHQVRVALTGSRSSFLAAYRGRADDVADALEHGWTYRGQPFSPWKGRPRGGEGRDLPAQAFVFCIENHDQVGNRPRGERLEHLVSPAAFRMASMFLCLSPYSVLLFMGQEWAASTPFLFFTDHGGDLGRAITAGRKREFALHADGRDDREPPDPEAVSTFTASKLRWEERSTGSHAQTLALYRHCLRERRRLAGTGAFDRARWRAVAHGASVALLYALPEGRRMLLAALGNAPLAPVGLPEALAPSAGMEWRVVLASEASRFGGAAGDPAEAWSMAGPSALWLEETGKGGAHASA